MIIDEQLDDIDANVRWLQAETRRTRGARHLRELRARLRLESENLKRWVQPLMGECS